MHAHVDWIGWRPGFGGTVTLHQERPDGPTTVEVALQLPEGGKLHGFHLHQKPALSAGDLDKTCATCGGHFNPTGAPHGSTLNDNPCERHVGDLINNVKADADGQVRVTFEDNLVTLTPTDARPYTVLGCSLVVHEGTDDLGRQGTFSGHPPYVDGATGQRHAGSGTFRRYPRCSKKERESLQTGNAGKRLACGNVVLSSPTERGAAPGSQPATRLG